MKEKITPAWRLRAAFLVLTVILGSWLAVRAAGNAAARANREGGYAPGVYTASASGFGGMVDVTVTVGDKGGITDVTAVGPDETPDVGGAAIPILVSQILQRQSADVEMHIAAICLFR